MDALERCPRCGARALAGQSDAWGKYDSCFMCGFVAESQKPVELPKKRRGARNGQATRWRSDADRLEIEDRPLAGGDSKPHEHFPPQVHVERSVLAELPTGEPAILMNPTRGNPKGASRSLNSLN